MKTFRLYEFARHAAIVVLWPMLASPVQSAEPAAAPLDVIANFADRLCQTVPLDVTATHVELNGSAKADLAGVIKKLANLGVDGAAKYSTDTSKNVLQTDLAPALKDARTCRLQVWNDLKDKFNIGDATQIHTCRDKSHGVESYQKQYDVTRTSPEMGGGFDQPHWCQLAVAQLQSEIPESELSVVGSSESSRSTCAPFNCPQYQYNCKIHVKTDPLYREKASPWCK